MEQVSPRKDEAALVPLDYAGETLGDIHPE